ncbi:MAG: glycosyltransferase family 2 protein [Betaproteobacteria bacterium]|nr:glycosyltransferase family 2 protein [Betaproteobacteria bacterium]
MNYLAACCVFKDESRYLREWVEYHHLVGVERFYMVSNDDSPEEAQALLRPYIERGLVVFGASRGGLFVEMQRLIYFDVIRLARGRMRWLAFLDADEFLLPVARDSVPELLEPFEPQAALAVNWACFGSSGLREAPALQIGGFRMRLRDESEENRVFKSIVDPARVSGPLNPHRFVLAGSAPLIDEFGAPVSHPWRNENDPFFGTRLRINHYRIRSAAEFAEKAARWRASGHPDLVDAEAVRRYWEHHDRNEVLDETIQRFVPEVERRLAAGRG